MDEDYKMFLFLRINKMEQSEPHMKREDKVDEFEHSYSRMHAPEKAVIVYQRRKGREVMGKNLVKEPLVPEIMVRQENEANTTAIVQIEEKPQKSAVKRHRKFNRKNTVGKKKEANSKSIFQVDKKPEMRNVKARSGRNGVHSKVRNVESFKCTDAYEKNKQIKDENGLGKEGNGETDSEMEILDISTEKGILQTFAPLKTFHIHSDDDNQHLRLPTKNDEFREKVLRVLRKPFDKKEYKSSWKALKNGSYCDHYPDLGRKLRRYRHKRGKCMAILRGFFFWLQNVPHDGVFKPWKDLQCLAVEPKYIKDFSPATSAESGS